MLSNFTKIVIKFSFGLFVLLSAIQDVSCMDMDDEMIGFFPKSIFDSPPDLGSPIAGPEAGAGTSVQKKRSRPDFSSPQAEESSENSESDMECFTLFGMLGEKKALEVQILNSALYKPEVSSNNVDLKFFTPEKINGYHNAGGETRELERKIRVVKALFPKHIQDTENFPRDDVRIFSPAARNLPREVVSELRALKLVFHLPDYATAEPLVIETEEERAVRKERQKKEFEASEAILGNLPKQLISEREAVLKPWVLYFNYVEMKKDEYSLGIGEKMRWPELAEAFTNYVVPYMDFFLEIEGFEVYGSLRVINFKRKNPKNQKENYETMGEGQAPIGVDGKPIHLHHVLQICARSHPMKITDDMKKNRESPYKLIYVPDFIHTEYTEFLHPSNYILPRLDIDRTAFGHSRKAIHKKVVELKYFAK